jgi:hypothetical protein
VKPPPDPPDDGQGDLFAARPPKYNLSGIPPEVVSLFESLSLRLAHDGWPRYSARAILHRIRWHYHVDKGDKEFKCNNNWTPRMARWFMDQHPELGEFFETRASPERHNMADYAGPYDKYSPPDP